MTRAIITGPKNIQETIIKELYNLKILHIVEHTKNELADIGKPLDYASRLSEILVKVRALISALDINVKKFNEVKFFDKTKIDSTTKKLSEEININLDELRKIEGQILKNESVKQELEILKNINVPLEAFTTYKSLSYFMGYIKENNVPTLRNELKKATEKFILFNSTFKNKNFIVLFIDATIKEQANIILNKAGFSHINFVNISNLRGSASDNLKKIEWDSIKLQKK